MPRRVWDLAGHRTLVHAALSYERDQVVDRSRAEHGGQLVDGGAEHGLGGPGAAERGHADDFGVRRQLAIRARRMRIARRTRRRARVVPP